MGEHRFKVDREGRVTDRDSTGERAAERTAEYNAEFNRTVERRIKEGYRATPEEQEKFLRGENYKQTKNTGKFGGGLIGLGLISFSKASVSPDGFGWIAWGVLGAVLIVMGALLVIYATYNRLRAGD